MRNKKAKNMQTILSIYLLILSMLANLSVHPFPVFAQTIKGPNVDSVKFVQYPDENIGLKAVQSGDIDTYFWNIPLELVPQVKKDPSLTVYERGGGSFGLLLNPAPSKDDSILNPFQFKQVRFAMNYLIDREFVANEVLKGSGIPMIDPFGVSSPEYQNIADIVESFGFIYDPHTAEKMIENTLNSTGATKQDGKWMYKGNPIAIKIFIRNDDPIRISIGEAISSELEKIGFTVEKIFGDLPRAQIDVYGSNPQDLTWQIYTEAFAQTAFVAYSPSQTAQMYAPWFANMPGRGNPGWWEYTNKTLDDITQKLVKLNFTSREERTQLDREAVRQGIQESVRLFIAQTEQPYVASASVKDLVNDFGTGIAGRFSLIDANPDNRDTLNVGLKLLSQGAWNNVEGFQDDYSTTIAAPLTDPAIFRDPYLGTVVPMRNNWTEIVTNGPTGSVRVSPMAIKWDPFSSQWKQSGDNQTSKSKITYKILYSNWHNGIPMDKNDLLYSYYFGFEWGTDTSRGNITDRTVDPEFTPTTSAVLPIEKGIRFLSDDTVESYVDVWHFDKGEIASYGTMWAAEPWEITAAQERLVEAGKLAFSRSAAVEKGVDWLSLINPQHADLIKAELQKMKDEKYIPPALKGLVSVEDAIKRYDASMKWINDHHHAFISNGPFYLDTYNAEGHVVTLKAFRDSTYPFPKGYWSSKFGDPKIASVKGVDTHTSITIGQPTTIDIYINIGGQPSNDAQVKYFISGDKGVVIEGNATASQQQPGKFQIWLSSNQTAMLNRGAYSLKVFATSNEAYKPAFFSTPILVGVTLSPLLASG